VSRSRGPSRVIRRRSVTPTESGIVTNAVSDTTVEVVELMIELDELCGVNVPRLLQVPAVSPVGESKFLHARNIRGQIPAKTALERRMVPP
jgi:hypothetical protein